MLFDTAAKILETGYICDHCLGRQFAKLVSDKTNEEKGKIIREFVTIAHQSNKTEADESNFKDSENQKCAVCLNVFSDLPKISKDVLDSVKKIDFETFLVGIKMNDPLVINEETLWENVGMKYSESIKTEMGREITKIVLSKKGKKVEHNRPDVLIIFDMSTKKLEIFPNSIFVHGEYKKYVRGLPQTSSKRHGKAVQDIIAKPFIAKTKAKEHTLHALGREDKDARCLVWRPFVLELKGPIKRKLDLVEIKKQINKGAKVKVNNLRITKKGEIAVLKSKMPYKVYSIVVDFEEPLKSPENVKKLVGNVKQRTPSRLLSSKTERAKNKKVKSIKWKRINNIRYRFEITTESGMFVNELISGDFGRTVPSLGKVLGNRAKIKEFDLIGLEE
ncbi:MAG: tRNA pseudouridine(54/55) synthase Pus10 [Candidatus Aenigmarchaeota archaeon]|nr:tRNA pseudouridine(54/55) synthase Pus10 [Candidatus Aenigmarchaeota archaeon]